MGAALIKKENQIFLIYKEIENAAVAKSYMTNCLLIYRSIFAHFFISGNRVTQIKSYYGSWDKKNASEWFECTLKKFSVINKVHVLPCTGRHTVNIEVSGLVGFNQGVTNY